MFWRIFGKVAFKALASLVLMVGLMSYMVYSQGGDPGKLLGGILQGAGQRLAGNAREAGQDGLRAMQEVIQSDSQAALRNTVYAWDDESGQRHYGPTPPPGVDARPIRLDRAPSGTVAPVASQPGSATPTQDSLDIPERPGLAGVDLPVNIDPRALGIDPQQLVQQIYGQRLEP